MQILGIDNVTGDDINRELQRGAKFVIFQYCISIIVMTFRNSSDVYFIRSYENAIGKRILYSLISLLFGWWGIPWGPIYTLSSIFNNLRGGKDVTYEIVATLKKGAEEESNTIQNQ